jgi:2-polyprenyl-6-methoxyphenol hydroxylase-like FAD-dependent oxidoreductase
VVGAGPTGLTLALQAHDHGARVRIVERRREPVRPSRALLLHSRTLEVLRPLGVTTQLLARADVSPEIHLHLGSRVVRVHLAELAVPDTAFPHLVIVRQMDVEAVLAQALADRGVAVEWGSELIAVQDRGTQARATVRTLAGVEQVDCDFVAGCDGPESTVRTWARLGWQGGPYHEEVVLADAELAAGLTGGGVHVVAGRQGLVFAFARGERAPWRLLATRPAGRDRLPFGQPGPPASRAEVQSILDDAGLDAQITELAWSARYRLQHRLAVRFRQGRLFLAGDAAHAFSPATGQGMNTGIQDAANLGWKLAFATTASNPTALLASYDRERRPVAARVLALTHLVFWAEAATGRMPSLLRGVVAPRSAPLVPAILGRHRPVAEAIQWASQLRTAYPGSPLFREARQWLPGGPGVGQRLPDATVTAEGRRVQQHSLLARPGVHVLLHRDGSRLDHLAFGTHVTVHRLTSVPDAGLIAVRPDGYVGFRCRIADAERLQAWLAGIGAGTSAGRRDPAEQSRSSV